MFALKIHALICRPFLKGRDWYDFLWYVKQGVRPNLAHLQAALDQYGPWKGQQPTVDGEWLQSALQGKIAALDWTAAAEDVRRFLDAAQQQSLRLWSEAFFLARVARLAR